MIRTTFPSRSSTSLEGKGARQAKGTLQGKVLSFASRFKIAMVAGALTAALTACPGDDGTGEPGDCGDDEIEHPYDGACVADCSLEESVCEGATPVCIGGSAGDGGVSSESSIFDGLCGCDADSCQAGEICHPQAGVCVTACDPFLTGGDGDAGSELDCPEIAGEEWACFAHPDVSDFICQPPCAINDDCTQSDYPVCDDGFCVATCDSAEELRLVCPDNDCNVVTGTCGGPNACMDNGDCGDRVCDIASGDCVDCMADDDCNGLICDLAAGTCAGCMEQADCGADLDCDIASGECFAVCAAAGTDPLCEATEVCIDGDPINFCEASCDDVACIEGTPGEQLCQLDTADADYNLCVEPNAATGGCDRVDLAVHTRDAGGPVIISISFIVESTNGNCAGTVAQYRALVYSADGLPGAIYTEGVTYINSVGSVGLTFGSLTESNAVAGMPDYYDVDFTLCELAAPVSPHAMYIDDVDGDSSNAICFDGGIF